MKAEFCFQTTFKKGFTPLINTSHKFSFIRRSKLFLVPFVSSCCATLQLQQRNSLESHYFHDPEEAVKVIRNPLTCSQKLSNSIKPLSEIKLQPQTC